MTAASTSSTGTTVQDKAVHTLVEWRHADKAVIANSDSRAARKAEYVARNKLREAADKVAVKGAQP